MFSLQQAVAIDRLMRSPLFTGFIAVLVTVIMYFNSVARCRKRVQRFVARHEIRTVSVTDGRDFY